MTFPDAPALSVVMTTHHRPLLLERALRSLASQQVQDFEVLVCADESSEATLRAAGRHLRPQDSLIALPGHRGPADTRNFGTRAARGRWVCYLDDDDTFEPGHLARALPLLEQAPSAMHFFNFTRIAEQRDGTTITELRRELVDTGGRDAAHLEVGNFIPNNAFFLPSRIAKCHDFDSRLPSHEDWEHLIGLSRSCDFIHHPQSGPNVHVNEGASRNNDAHRSNGIVLDYLSIYRKWPARSEPVRQARQQTLAHMGINLPASYL